MEEAKRRGEIVVKNRNASGCLIIRKKSDGAVGSSAGRLGSSSSGLLRERRRSRPRLSDSGSSDELLEAREGSRGIRGFSDFDNVDESEYGGRKRVGVEHQFEYRSNVEDSRKSQISRLDVFEFDEYDRFDENKRLRQEYLDECARREFEAQPSGGSGDIVYKRRNMYFQNTSGLADEGSSEMDYSVRSDRFEMKREGTRRQVQLLREKYSDATDKPIRLQGKNGVLKVMVNKKRASGLLKTYDRWEVEGYRKGLRAEDSIKRNQLARSSFPLETNPLDEGGSGMTKKKYRTTAVPVDRLEKNRQDNVPVNRIEKIRRDEAGSFSRIEKNQWRDASSASRMEKIPVTLKKSPATKKRETSEESESDESDTALRLGSGRTESHKSLELGKSMEVKTLPSEKLLSVGGLEGKVRRGSGTEKQKLREHIREMLKEAGWTIDYRPRRNRDYQDAVYVNPSGTAYWSIIKAYDALQKQFGEEKKKKNSEPMGDPSFTPISDNILSKLTRQTKRKMEKEMKRKHKNVTGSRDATVMKRSEKARHATENIDTDENEDKLSSFMKQGGKSVKGRINENLKSESHVSLLEQNGVHSNTDGLSSQGRKSRKLGRCTLLVRTSNKGPTSEDDGYIPYTGKRTLLSWLIDCGIVQLNEKVRYMNRRRNRVLQQGWITKDGIHCVCCSKIVTVSKFEIHAGSKLRQPFQHILLESGSSLLECLIKSLNKQNNLERCSFNHVTVDGDDPNDDTCGLCGDGGDLICCDGCPSTFHLACLGIKMLPPGDWNCPNCICHFCRMTDDSTAAPTETTRALLTCNLCERKYHKSCVKDVDTVPVSSFSSSFCGNKCRELWENLQNFVGVKHELEAGFSWSLIHRTDTGLDTPPKILPQRVECNAKIAVALTIMDECFIPIVDRRSGVNLIHNVLYNSGSNFNRLNYGGFYTAVLERGDEIISAASLRFHGARLAEMPFVGTRHIYRCQGMFRRLFCAIESALCSFKVEKLVIPAISELMHTWTEVFGFDQLDEQDKQELRSMNMLVFPGIDILQKLLVADEDSDSLAPITGVDPSEHREIDCCTTGEDSSSGRNTIDRHDDASMSDQSKADDRVSSSGPSSPGSPNKATLPDASKEMIHSTSDSAEKLPDPATTGHDDINEQGDASLSGESIADDEAVALVPSRPVSPNEVKCPDASKEKTQTSESGEKVPDLATM